MQVVSNMVSALEWQLQPQLQKQQQRVIGPPVPSSCTWVPRLHQPVHASVLTAGSASLPRMRQSGSHCAQQAQRQLMSKAHHHQSCTHPAQGATWTPHHLKEHVAATTAVDSSGLQSLSQQLTCGQKVSLPGQQPAGGIDMSTLYHQVPQQLQQQPSVSQLGSTGHVRLHLPQHLQLGQSEAHFCVPRLSPGISQLSSTVTSPGSHCSSYTASRQALQPTGLMCTAQQVVQRLPSNQVRQ